MLFWINVHSLSQSTTSSQTSILGRTIKAAIAASSSSSSQKCKGLQDPFKVETKFILIGTKHPGNVGSSARSMKTMGFTEGLVLVNPHDAKVLRRKKCIDAASGAVDVLDSATVIQTDIVDEENENLCGGDGSNCRRIRKAVEAAFGSKDTNYPILVCGTGMPVDMANERSAQNYFEPRRLFQELVAVPEEGSGVDDSKDIISTETFRIAFLFGSERYGMTAEDMEECDVMLGIPTNPHFGSLNLATAVQIIAYDWRQALGGFETADTD